MGVECYQGMLESNGAQRTVSKSGKEQLVQEGTTGYNKESIQS